MRYKIAALIVVLQVAFFLGWSAFEQGMFDSGPSTYIRVKTVPVDPRDYLSGQYITLGYEFSSTGRWSQETQKWEDTEYMKETLQGIKPGQYVWIVLHPEGEFYVPYRMEKEKPTKLQEGYVTFRGMFVHYNRLEYGIEKYFFPESIAPPATMQDVTVELRISPRGVARVNKVFVKDKPWP